jgi:hypothetical protein
MMGHMSFDPIIMLPQDRKPKRYMFWLHIVQSYYFRLFIDKNRHDKRRDASAALFKIWLMEAKVG